MFKKIDISLEELKSLLKYDENTGVFSLTNGIHYWLQSANPYNVYLYIGNTTGAGWLGAKMTMDSGY